MAEAGENPSRRAAIDPKKQNQISVSTAHCSTWDYRQSQGDGGQVLLLLERGPGDPLARQGARDAPIQEGGGQLDGVARHDARVEAVWSWMQ